MASLHYDVIKWKNFPRYWPFAREIHRSPVNSPHKGQWRGALMFPLIHVRINGWVNKREAGDLRRNHAHYDVTVMTWKYFRRHWPHVRGSTGNRWIPLTKDQWRETSLFLLLLAWTSCWSNSWFAGDFRRYDICIITIMSVNLKGKILMFFINYRATSSLDGKGWVELHLKYHMLLAKAYL